MFSSQFNWSVCPVCTLMLKHGRPFWYWFTIDSEHLEPVLQSNGLKDESVVRSWSVLLFRLFLQTLWLMELMTVFIHEY